MIKAIIFDCFGVLVTEGWEPFVEEHFISDENKLQEARDYLKRLNLGMLSYEEFLEKVSSLAGVSVEDAKKTIDDNRANVKLFEYIKELRKTYKISMLSNAGGDWMEELFTADQLSLFDDIVLSYQHSVAKPQQEIYHLAAERLGCEPSDCVLIDDTERHCGGAKEAGMKAILYKNFAQLKRDLAAIL